MWEFRVFFFDPHHLAQTNPTPKQNYNIVQQFNRQGNNSIFISFHFYISNYTF